MSHATAEFPSSDAARGVMARLRRDPAFFCREVLGVRLWSKQFEVLCALRDHDRVAVRSGHGTGKSFTAAAAALWFLYAFHRAKVLTTAPTQTQVRHILWAELRRLHDQARVPLGGKLLEDRVRLDDDAFALGLSTDEAERFQGFHAEHMLVILDEAPGVREDIWHAAETLLTGRVGKILVLGNPTRADGLFHRCFRPDSPWKRIRISCFDCPNLAAEAAGGALPFPRLVTRRWIEARRRDWGEESPLWRSRVLGEFPAEDASRLVPSAWLEAAGRDGELPPRRGRLRLGVDVARQGTDETVLLLRDDAAVRRLAAWSGLSTMDTAGRVRRWMEDFGVRAEDVYIDDTGLGAGVTDRLRELECPVVAVLAAARADDPAHYANVRAECAWRMRQWLSPDGGGRIAASEADLLRELSALTIGFSSAGALRVEEKASIRAGLGGSPDRADALALTFASGGESAADPMVSIW